MSDELEPIAADPWPKYAAVTLVFCGFAYFLIGLGYPALFAFVMTSEGEMGATEAAALSGAVFVLVFAFLGAVAVFNWVAAFGIYRERKWGWVLTLVLGALYAPSACLPFGIVLLYATLNERTRKRILG